MTPFTCCCLRHATPTTSWGVLPGPAAESSRETISKILEGLPSVTICLIKSEVVARRYTVEQRWAILAGVAGCTPAPEWNACPHPH